VKVLGEGSEKPTTCPTRGLASKNIMMKVKHFIEEVG